VNFNDYQKQALTTAIHHPDPIMDKTIWVLGIAGEAGEIVEKWKKIVAYYDGVISPENLVELKKELGDVMWYLALMAESLGLSLEEIAELNLEKLASRKERNVQRGSGDNR
jgi:NTP pyrophosphatase (non-canonical NTP hydrolase)